MEAYTKKEALSTAEDSFKVKKKMFGILNREQQHMEKEMK